MTAPVAQRRAEGLCWVLSLEADRVYRWASHDVEVQLDGAVVEAWSGLAIETYEETLEGSDDGAVVAVPLGGIPDLARLVASLGAAVADLALCRVDGGVVELAERMSVAGGRVLDLEVDPDGAVATLQLRTVEASDTADLCGARWAADDRTWPLATEDARGARVPLVYGRPGSFEFESLTDTDATPVYDYEDVLWGGGSGSITWEVTRTTRTAGATPAVPVEREVVTRHLIPWDTGSPTFSFPGDVQWLALCQGHAPADTAELWARWETHGPNLGGWITATVNTTTGYDGRGQPVTLADISGLNGQYRTAGAWMIAWTDGGAISDGLVGVERGALGAVATWVLRRSSLPVAWSEVHRVAWLLDRYQIGGHVDESISPTAWCTDRLARHGVAVRWTRGGLGLAVVWEPSPLPVGRLDLDGDAYLAAPVRYLPASADVVIVRWARAESTVGRSAESRIEAVQPEAGGAEVVIELPECWDSATAIDVGTVELRRLGGHVEIVVMVPTDRWWWLRPGDVVDVSLTSLAWTPGPASRWQVSRCTHTSGAERSLTLRKISRRRVRASATVSAARVDTGG